MNISVSMSVSVAMSLSESASIPLRTHRVFLVCALRHDEADLCVVLCGDLKGVEKVQRGRG
jgi:hypothetical protein